MLFLGIDQHARQLTVSLRDQQGDVLLACYPKTRPMLKCNDRNGLPGSSSGFFIRHFCVH